MEQSEAVCEVVGENVRVVVDNNVLGRVEVDDEQSGFPEIRLVLMNSFRTRTNLERNVRVVVDEDVCVVVDNNVCGRVEVDDEQSGFPETIRWVMNSFRT